MPHCIVIGIVFFAYQLVTVQTNAAKDEPSVLDLAKIVEEAYNNGSINVCDETNANNSYIYCYGRLLAAVNVHGLYKDSKTFVDMPSRFSPEETQLEFDRRFGSYELQDIDRVALQAFVDEYFEPTGAELEACELKEWIEYPPRLMRIQDSMLREWALKLNAIWKLLCRKMKPNDYPDRNSLIYVPEEFIVPGGRFREFYYWDAYWIVKGLAACGLQNTIKKMIINFVSVVNRYGFIPNGGRIYYLARSQPPMLIPMVYEYFELTHDVQFIAEVLPTLIKEYEFWQNNRAINVSDNNGNTFSVFQYHTKSNVPRPEAFRVDIVDASHLPAHKRQKFYMDVASAAESGWDFTSRWFQDRRTIETIETTDIIPIDLNAFICWNLDILQYLLKRTGDFSAAVLEPGNYLKSKTFRDRREILRYAMLRIFYNTDEGAWFDYNLRTKSQNTNFYPSVAVPLFGECYQPLNLARSQHIVEYLNKSGVYDFPGGVPTSLKNDTDQQWDFPNGWSPLNHMIIEGMRKSTNPVVQEQYNVIGTVSQPGSGGEYDVQDGFGWSNGVILDLLTTYYDRIHIEPGDLEDREVTTDAKPIADSAFPLKTAYTTTITATAISTFAAYLLKH